MSGEQLLGFIDFIAVIINLPRPPEPPDRGRLAWEGPEQPRPWRAASRWCPRKADGGSDTGVVSGPPSNAARAPPGRRAAGRSCSGRS